MLKYKFCLLFGNFCFFYLFSACTSIGNTDSEESQEESSLKSNEMTESVEVGNRQNLNSAGLTTFFLTKKTMENMNIELQNAQETLKAMPYDLKSFKLFAYDSLSKSNPEGSLKLMEIINQKNIQLDDEACLIVGISHLMRNEQTEAFKMLDKAATLNPRNILPDLNIAVYFLAHGNAFHASTYLGRVLSLEPSNTTANLYSGIAQFYLKDYKKAEIYLSRATGVKGNIGYVAKYNMGLIYLNAYKKKADARKLFINLVENNDVESDLKNQAQALINNIDQNLDENMMSTIVE